MGFFVRLLGSIADLQAAILRFIRTADPDHTIARINKAKQTSGAAHQCPMILLPPGTGSG
jgi:hypothetical protein